MVITCAAIAAKVRMFGSNSPLCAAIYSVSKIAKGELLRGRVRPNWGAKRASVVPKSRKTSISDSKGECLRGLMRDAYRSYQVQGSPKVRLCGTVDASFESLYLDLNSVE